MVYAVTTAVLPKSAALPLWRALAAADAPATIPELHRATGVHPNSVALRLNRWLLAGFVTVIEGRPLRYAMTEHAPKTPTPPTVNRAGRVGTTDPTQRERLWRAIRILRSFDLPGLMITSEAGRRSAEDFVNVLCRAGYLKRTTRGNAMLGTWSVYRLTKAAGPLCPRIEHRKAGRPVRELVDPNDGSRHDVSPGKISLNSLIKRGVS